jgi:Putative phage metallopeptidase
MAGKFGYKAGKDVAEIVRTLLAENHEDAHRAGVRVGVTMVRSESGPALKHHGQAAAAIIGPVGWELRAQGAPDVLIRVDARVWENLESNPRARLALIDHELTHIHVMFGEDGKAKKDGAGRPTVRMRPHDFELGVFKCIIDRWGFDSIDAYNVAMTAREAGGQMLMPFLDGSEDIVHPTGETIPAARADDEGDEGDDAEATRPRLAEAV